MNSKTKTILGWSAFGVVAVLAGGLLFQSIRAKADTADGDAAPSYKLIGDDVVETDAEAVKTAGLTTVTVETKDLPVTLTLTGRTGLDMETVTHVHAQFGGKVTQIKPELGAVVKGPDAPGGATVLCVIESNDLAQAKSNYLQAKVQLKLDQDNLDRTQELVKSTVLAPKFLLDAQSAVTKDAAALEAARQQLLIFGLTKKEFDQIDTQQGQQRMDYIITSPRSGVIAEKGVAGGEIADPTINLFTVADTSTMWVWGDVYERDLRQVKIGEPVKAVFTSDPDHPRECTIDWISPVLDPNTHSIRVRGSVDNTDGRLLADMYGTLSVTVDAGKNSVVVPADCVIRRGTAGFVFVKEESENNSIHYRRTPVKVEPVNVGFGVSDSAAAATSAGGDNNTHTEGDAPPSQPLRIVDGLKPGQTIVRNGALGLFNFMEQAAQ